MNLRLFNDVVSVIQYAYSRQTYENDCEWYIRNYTDVAMTYLKILSQQSMDKLRKPTKNRTVRNPVEIRIEEASLHVYRALLLQQFLLSNSMHKSVGLVTLPNEGQREVIPVLN
jgi:hypothetical protein